MVALAQNAITQLGWLTQMYTDSEAGASMNRGRAIDTTEQQSKIPKVPTGLLVFTSM
jgi:hypothetical protein